MNRFVIASALSAIAVAFACQSETLRLQHANFPVVPLPERAKGPSFQPLRVASFNAGLAVGMVKHAAERAPAVVSAIASEQLDLLCVQEFWLEEHWAMLRERTKSQLPHALRPQAASAGGTKPCTAAELAPVARCAVGHCWSEAAGGAAECAMRHCGHLARGLGPECIGCLSRHPMRRIGEILDECVDPELPKTAADENDASKGPRFYDGSYGIGLLSSRPLKDTDRLDLEAAHHPRGVLHAEIELGEEPLHVFCTHLTPILRGVPHPTGGSWTTEQSQQVDALLAYIERKAGDEPALVLGDLNTGPGVAGIQARTPEHYARFVRAGFVNPYLDATQPRCSFCYENPVIGGKSGGMLIDHVLVRGFEGSFSARRFLDQPIDLSVRGHKQTSALSDHYGIVAELVPAGG